MQIKSEVKYVMVGQKGYVFTPATSYQKRDCIEIFMQDEEKLTWRQFSKKYGWKCVKVRVSYEQLS